MSDIKNDNESAVAGRAYLGKAIFCFILLAVMAVVYIMIDRKSVAWFAHNTSVSGDGMTISASSPIELIYNDNVITVVYENDNGHNEITPGDHGILSITFTSSQSGKLHYDISPKALLKGEDGETSETLLDEDEPAFRYLMKHICFFSTKTGTGDDTVYSGWINSEYISGDVEVTGETQTTIELFWVWRQSYLSYGSDFTVADEDKAKINLDCFGDDTNPPHLDEYFDKRNQTEYNQDYYSVYYDYADDTISRKVGRIGFDIKIASTD